LKKNPFKNVQNIEITYNFTKEIPSKFTSISYPLDQKRMRSINIQNEKKHTQIWKKQLVFFFRLMGTKKHKTLGFE